MKANYFYEIQYNYHGMSWVKMTHKDHSKSFSVFAVSGCVPVVILQISIVSSSYSIQNRILNLKI